MTPDPDHIYVRGFVVGIFALAGLIALIVRLTSV